MPKKKADDETLTRGKKVRRTTTEEQFIPEGETSEEDDSQRHIDTQLRKFFDLLQNPKMRIFVDRLGPIEYDGRHLGGKIEEFGPPYSFEEIQTEVAQKHGGGRYRVRILNEIGQTASNRAFSVSGDPIPPHDPAKDKPDEIRQLETNIEKTRREKILLQEKRELEKAASEGSASEEDASRYQDLISQLVEANMARRDEGKEFMQGFMAMMNQQSAMQQQLSSKQEDANKNFFQLMMGMQADQTKTTIAMLQAQSEQAKRDQERREKEQESQRIRDLEMFKQTAEAERERSKQLIESERKSAERNNELMMQILQDQLKTKNDNISSTREMFMESLHVAMEMMGKNPEEDDMFGKLNKTIGQIASIAQKANNQDKPLGMPPARQIEMGPDGMTDQSKAAIADEVNRRVAAHMATMQTNAPATPPQPSGSEGNSDEDLGTPEAITMDRQKRVNLVMRIMLQEMQVRPRQLEWIETAYSDLPNDVLEAITNIDYGLGVQESLQQVFAVIHPDSTENTLSQLRASLDPKSHPGGIAAVMSNAMWLIECLKTLQQIVRQEGLGDDEEEEGAPTNRVTTPPPMVNQFSAPKPPEENGSASDDQTVSIGEEQVKLGDGSLDFDG